MLGFQDSRNCELVLHNPPLNLFVILILPFLPFNSLMPTVSKWFSVFIFWIENIAFLVEFMLLQTFLSPLIYAKTFYTIIASNDGFFTLLLYIAFWMVFGFLLLVYIQFFDLANLLDILLMHDGCKANSDVAEAPEEDEPEIDMERLAGLYNEVRTCAWNIYRKSRRDLWNKPEETTEE